MRETGEKIEGCGYILNTYMPTPNLLKPNASSDPAICNRKMLDPFITSQRLLTPQAKPSLILGRYEKIRSIGKGTFGKVMKCIDLATNKEVAVKKIDHANIKSSRERKNVARELRLLKVLRHPYIIRILDMHDENGSTYIIMEIASNGELHDYVTAKKGLGEDEARMLFRQMISAVDYIHTSSIVHRDLKPENMLLDDHHRIKLIDFGFGNTYAVGSALSTYCGSPFYAAPEMTQGIPYCGPEVDIWSLGVILYMMLTGKLPFNGSNISELYTAIASGNFIRPAVLSKSASDLLGKMLCVSPSRRATMEIIRSHPWVQETWDIPINSYIPQRDSIQSSLDEEVLQELKALGYDRREYFDAFSQPFVKSPVKSLYHLHKEMMDLESGILKDPTNFTSTERERWPTKKSSPLKTKKYEEHIESLAIPDIIISSDIETASSRSCESPLKRMILNCNPFKKRKSQSSTSA